LRKPSLVKVNFTKYSKGQVLLSNREESKSKKSAKRRKKGTPEKKD